MKISKSQATHLLKSGAVVGIPTETVYGLAALYNDPSAIKEIYRLKNRPPKNPLIMHLAEKHEVLNFVSELPFSFDALASAFWPGPMTLVMPVFCDKVPEIVRAGLSTQAFRIPNHPVALELIGQTGPLVAPSANVSGRPSSSSFAHVEADFGNAFPVLDGGICSQGVESTILIFQEDRWVIGRLGAIEASDFEPILGYVPEEMIKGALICPGQLYRHYAPLAKLDLTNDFKAAKVIIGFNERIYPGHAKVIRWGSIHHPKEVLSHLYETLRFLDREKIMLAHIDSDFPNLGLWRTLQERLQKAAT